MGKAKQLSKGSAPAAKNFKDRNLMGVSPLRQQFEPTDAMPVKQHFKMAGGA